MCIQVLKRVITNQWLKLGLNSACRGMNLDDSVQMAQREVPSGAETLPRMLENTGIGAGPCQIQVYRPESVGCKKKGMVQDKAVPFFPAILRAAVAMQVMGWQGSNLLTCLTEWRLRLRGAVSELLRDLKSSGLR